jgi:hypothetical protein
MLQRHGDPLYSDKKKKAGARPGVHIRRGYRNVTGLADAVFSGPITDPAVDKTSRPHAQATRIALGLRKSGRRREWEHRKITGAKTGEIVHHVDGEKLNNILTNLHVFPDRPSHVACHRSLEKCAYALIAHGLVRFDPDEGVYRLAESVLRSI